MVSGRTETEAFRTSVETLKSVQYLIDQTMRSQLMLDLNCTVMATLMEKLGLEMKQDSGLEEKHTEFRETVDSIQRESQMLYKNAASLCARASRISQHVSQGFSLGFQM